MVKRFSLGILGSFLLYCFGPMVASFAGSPSGQSPPRVLVEAPEPANQSSFTLSERPPPAAPPARAPSPTSDSIIPLPHLPVQLDKSAPLNHVSKLTDAAKAEIERLKGVSVLNTAEGNLSLLIRARPQSLVLHLQDGKLRGGQEVIALTISKDVSLPVPTPTSSRPTGLRISQTDAYADINIGCSYIRLNPATNDLEIYVCGLDMPLVQTGVMVIATSVGALIGLGFGPAGSVVGGVIGGFVGLAVLVGLRHFQNPVDNSLSIIVPYSTWRNLVGWAAIGQIPWYFDWVNSPCQVYVEGTWYYVCAQAVGRWTADTYDWRFQVFVRDPNGVESTVAQSTPGGGWAGFTGIGCCVINQFSRAAAARNADGTLELLSQGPGGGLYDKYQLQRSIPPNWVGNWADWVQLFCCMVGVPTIVTALDGRLATFFRGGDNHLYHMWQGVPSGAWTGFLDLGGDIRSDPSAFRSADGRLQVFVLGSNQHVYSKWQVTPGGGWTDYADFGCCVIGNPIASMNADGRAELFVRGGDGGFWHIWQGAPGGGWTTSWAPLGGSLGSDPVTTLVMDGRLAFFYIGQDQHLWHIWQLQAGGNWSGWLDLGCCVAGMPDVLLSYDGRMEVWAIGTGGTAGHLVTAWQVTAGGGWSYGDLGGRWVAP